MARNSIGQLYVGVSKNPQDRLVYHNQGRGASFTKQNPNYKIVFLEKYSVLAGARKREIQIKKWRREKKEMLILKYSMGVETKQ